MQSIRQIASRTIRKLSQALIVLSIGVLVTACASSAEQFFTAVFDKSATVVRAWGEACIANNLTKADEYLLPDGGGDLRPSICNKLANHPNRDKLFVLSVEDHGSLIGSRTLIMRVKNRATGKSVLLQVYLANTERGVRIASVDDYSSWADTLR